jgi:hypothetical protein
MNEETLFHLAPGKPVGERATFLEQGGFLRQPALNSAATVDSQAGPSADKGDDPGVQPIPEGPGRGRCP